MSSNLSKCIVNLNTMEKKILLGILKNVSKENFNKEFRLSETDLNKTELSFDEVKDSLNKLFSKRFQIITEEKMAIFSIFTSITIVDSDIFIRFNNSILNEYLMKPNYYNQILQLKNETSILLYNYLKDKLDNKIEVSVSALRNSLGFENKYNQYGHFKDRVLVPFINDINTNTSLQIDFLEITKGRKVTDIQFSVEEVCD